MTMHRTCVACRRRAKVGRTWAAVVHVPQYTRYVCSSICLARWEAAHPTPDRCQECGYAMPKPRYRRGLCPACDMRWRRAEKRAQRREVVA